MVEKPKAKSEDRMAIDPRGQNAPNKPEEGRNLGGKVETGKNEGGTKTEEDKKQEDARNREKLIGRLGGAGSLSSMTQEEADKLAEGNHETEFKEDGRTVLVSSISEEETAKVKAGGAVSSAPVNFTQNLTGVPGNVDLTQGGRLSGDKSVRAQRTIEDINEELEKTSGPNPQPNREGNEILKATQGVLSVGYVANTAAIADELKEMLKKDSLDAKDKERLSDIEKQLRINTRVA